MASSRNGGSLPPPFVCDELTGECGTLPQAAVFPTSTLSTPDGTCPSGNSLCDARAILAHRNGIALILAGCRALSNARMIAGVRTPGARLSQGANHERVIVH